jgi:hypothetical protein
LMIVMREILNVKQTQVHPGDRMRQVFCVNGQAFSNSSLLLD